MYHIKVFHVDLLQQKSVTSCVFCGCTNICQKQRLMLFDFLLRSNSSRSTSRPPSCDKMSQMFRSLDELYHIDNIFWWVIQIHRSVISLYYRLAYFCLLGYYAFLTFIQIFLWVDQSRTFRNLGNYSSISLY